MNTYRKGDLLGRFRGSVGSRVAGRPAKRRCKAVTMARLENRLLFATYYVDAAGGGTGSGTSWANAFTTLTAAIAAVGANDAIHIAQGVYTPTNGTDRTLSFALPSKLNVTGGYLGKGGGANADQPGGETILSGLLNNGTHSYHVVTITGATSLNLSKVTISGGRADGGGSNQNNGSGVFDTSSLTVQFISVIFKNNTGSSSTSGGGVYVNSGAGGAASFFSCTFQNNTANQGGAALVATVFTTFSQCTFLQNTSSNTGGALDLSSGAATGYLNISQCTFTDNTANTGGAIYMITSEAAVSDCTFVGNRALSGNGGAIENVFSSSLILDYCTFTLNTSSAAGGAVDIYQSTATVADSIFWNDSAAGASSEFFTFSNTTPPSTVTAKYSIVKGGLAGTAILNQDPIFVKAPTRTSGVLQPGDLRLRNGSPAIDAGTTSTGFVVTTDLVGAARVQGALPDIGALEGGVEAVPPVSNVVPFNNASGYTNSLNINLIWTGSDASGIASYTIYVSTNAGPYVPYLTDTTLTQANFAGVAGSTYRFYSLATDTVYNQELKPSPQAEATLTIDQSLPVVSIIGLPPYTNQTTFTVNWGGTDTGSGIASYTILLQRDGTYINPLVTQTTATSSIFTGIAGSRYTFRILAMDAAGNSSPNEETADYSVTIDTTAPTAALSPLSSTSTTAALSLVWSGTDASTYERQPLTYSVFASDNGGPFTPVLTNKQLTNTTYPGVDGHRYGFYVVATDVAGNTTAKPAVAETTTLVDTSSPVTSVSPLPAYTTTKVVTLNWTASDGAAGSGVAFYNVYVSVNSKQYVLFQTTTSASVQYSAANGQSLAFNVRATDVAGNVEPSSVNPVVTYVDTQAPTSGLNALPSFVTTTAIPLTWSGSDPETGTVAGYSVFVSDNGGAYAPFLSGTRARTATFTGIGGHRYGFYVVAIDVAGNLEAAPAVAQVTTLVDLASPVSSVAALPTKSTATAIPLMWSGTDDATGVVTYAVFVSDNGGAYTPFLSSTQATTATYTGVDGHRYNFYTVATDAAGRVETIPTAADATTLVYIDTPLLTEAGSGAANAANLVFSPVKLALPKTIKGAIVGGNVITGTVQIKNTGKGLAKGALAVRFYLSSDNLVSSKDVLLTTVKVKTPISLKTKQTVTVPFSVKLPVNMTGTVDLLAWANAPGSKGTVAVLESTTLDDVAVLGKFALAAPVLNLAAGKLKVASATKGKTSTATLTVRNDSNVAFNKALPILVTVRDATGKLVSQTKTTTKQAIGIGQSVSVSIPFTGPKAGGSYVLNVTLDPANVLKQSQTDDGATVPFSIR